MEGTARFGGCVGVYEGGVGEDAGSSAGQQQARRPRISSFKGLLGRGSSGQAASSQSRFTNPALAEGELAAVERGTRWVKYRDQDGQAYYHNEGTEETTWKKPKGVARSLSTRDGDSDGGFLDDDEDDGDFIDDDEAVVGAATAGHGDVEDVYARAEAAEQRRGGGGFLYDSDDVGLDEDGGVVAATAEEVLRADERRGLSLVAQHSRPRCLWARYLHSESGRMYYAHEDTGVRTWQRPESFYTDSDATSDDSSSGGLGVKILDDDDEDDDDDEANEYLTQLLGEDGAPRGPAPAPAPAPVRAAATTRVTSSLLGAPQTSSAAAEARATRAAEEAAATQLLLGSGGGVNPADEDRRAEAEAAQKKREAAAAAAAAAAKEKAAKEKAAKEKAAAAAAAAAAAPDAAPHSTPLYSKDDLGTSPSTRPRSDEDSLQHDLSDTQSSGAQLPPAAAPLAALTPASAGGNTVSTPTQTDLTAGRGTSAAARTLVYGAADDDDNDDDDDDDE
eukprot:Rhum_TRINITY_DN14847_c5_g1::Rhum_TRINITY_DN14847_c5_g1_i1::g.125703::m.125703